MGSPDTGVTVAIIALISGVVIALIAWLRFRRKDHAEVDAVDAGTFSAMFKDVDSLVRYINERVRAETAELREQVEQTQAEMASVKRETHEIFDAFRAFWLRIWFWDQRGRSGDIPTLPDDILSKLGIKEPLETTQPKGTNHD